MFISIIIFILSIIRVAVLILLEVADLAGHRVILILGLPVLILLIGCTIFGFYLFLLFYSTFLRVANLAGHIRNSRFFLNFHCFCHIFNNCIFRVANLTGQPMLCFTLFPFLNLNVCSGQ